MITVMKQLTFSLIALGMMACSEEIEEVVQYSEPKGALKIEKIYASLDATDPVRFGEYAYDTEGNLVKITYYEYPDMMYYYVQKEYDLQNRLSREVSYVQQNGVMAKGITTVYEYKNDLLVRKSFHDDKEEFFGEHLHEYDLQGNQTKLSVYNSELRLFSYTIYRYQENRLVRQLDYAKDPYEEAIVLAYAYRYDDQGKLQTRFFLADDLTYVRDWVKPGVDEAYSYNQQGRLSKKIRYDPWWGYGVTEVVEYEYF